MLVRIGGSLIPVEQIKWIHSFIASDGEEYFKIRLVDGEELMIPICKAKDLKEFIVKQESLVDHWANGGTANA